MRKFTFLFVFVFAAALAGAQKPVVTPVWEHSVNSTATWDGDVPIVPGVLPDWMGNMTERGMAFYDGKLYIMSRKVTPHVIQVLDAETGNALTSIPIDTAIVKGGTYLANDLVITPSGKILFGNLATNTKTQPFKVYMMAPKEGGGYTTTTLLSWNSKDSIEGVQQPMYRLGDGFAFYGEVSAEDDGYILVADANATAPFSDVPKVFRWNVTAGVAAAEPQIIILKSVYPAPTGTNVPKLGISPRLQPLDNDHFWADGHSVYPALYDMQGELLTTFKGKFKPIQSGISGVNFFHFRGKDYMLAPATNHAAPAYAKKAMFELLTIPAAGAEEADSVAVFPPRGLGGNTNSSYVGATAVDIQSDKVMMFFMSPYNGIACYQLAMVGEVGNNTWNMSDPAFNALGSMVATQEVNGLTIYAAEGKNVDVDGNNKSLDGWNFTHRLKFGGTGAFDTDGKPVNRVLSFPVPGPSKITVYLQSSSTSADRTLNVAIDHKDSIVGTIPALGASISKGVVEYTGDAGTIYLSSLSSGINIYLIQVEPLATSVPQITAPGRGFVLYPNPARDRVFINVDQPTEVGVFSITGSLMLTKRVESPNDPIDVTGLTRGMYLVRPLKTTSFALKLIVQ